MRLLKKKEGKEMSAPLIPAQNFNLGPGLARPLDTLPLIERFRYDNHAPYGPHINCEVIMPLNGTNRTCTLSNTHIPL